MGNDYQDWIGQKVSKTAIGKGQSPKPFKSGNKINTISGLTINPHTGKDAFTFEEDDSIVDCYICEIQK